MRTLEQLEKDEYKCLTYGEFSEYELSCKDYCPLYCEFCNGGICCYGDTPIEPPCCYFEEDDILDDKYNQFYDTQKHYEAWKGEQVRKQKEKEEKARIRKQKLLEYKYRNYNELKQVKYLQKDNKQLQKQIDRIERAKIFCNSINIVNDMFESCNFSHPNNVDTNKHDLLIKECKDKIELNNQKIKEIKELIKQHEKQAKKLFLGEEA